MSMDLIDKVVAALRETAAKAKEQTRTEMPAGPYNSSYGRNEPSISIEDTYSRDWIIGRLIGMADMIEAMTIKRDANS